MRPSPLLVVVALAATACHRPMLGAEGSATERTGTDRVATAGEWEGRAVTRVEELFAGRFTGVQVIDVPGQGISVRIRGGSSILGSNEPLYVLDGMPLQASPTGLLNINPSDVARIEILKDVGALAMYGVRGANGVVLITTKRSR